MTLFNRITAFVDRLQLIPPDSSIVVGLSGGPDSIFLLNYLVTLRETRPFTLVLAHLNHGWRVTSDHDEQFCANIAHQLGLPIVIRHARDYITATRWTGSREDQARVMRRTFFADVAREYNNARVALAHHQDDQYETFFIRLVRGAGLQGLRGMVPQADQYIRPLLCVRKEEIIEYLRVHHLQFVIDSTNEDAAYLRNRIRHQVIPALRTCDARFPVSLHQTMLNLAEADDFCTDLAEKTFTTLAAYQDNSYWIDSASLLALHPFLQKQVLIRWLCHVDVPFTPSQGLFHEITKFLQQPHGGTHHISPHWHLQKKHNKARICVT